MKQKIDSLQSEVNDLQDVLLSLCDAHVSGHSATTLNLIHANVGHGGFSRMNDLAQVLRSSTTLSPPNHPNHARHQPAGFAQTMSAFDPTIRISQPAFGVKVQSVQQDGVAASPTTDGQSEWSVGESREVDDDAEHGGYTAKYTYQ